MPSRVMSPGGELEGFVVRLARNQNFNHLLSTWQPSELGEPKHQLLVVESLCIHIRKLAEQSPFMPEHLFHPTLLRSFAWLKPGL